MISALEETEQGKECRECWLQGPVFSYFQGFHAEEDILLRCLNTSSLSLSSRRPCDKRDCCNLPPPLPSLTHALTKRSLLCLVVATCWSMTSFKITLVVLLIHLRWHVRFADAAHSLKFREVLTCCKKKTNCTSFLAEAGECLLVFSFLVYLGLHILR